MTIERKPVEAMVQRCVHCASEIKLTELESVDQFELLLETGLCGKCQVVCAGYASVSA